MAMRTLGAMVLLLYYFILAKGRPQNADSFAKIVRYTNDNDGLGNYKFEYETENGIVHSEEGALKQVGTDTQGIVAAGSYQYRGAKGELISVSYTADENGYRPKVIIDSDVLGESRASPALVASLVG